MDDKLEEGLVEGSAVETSTGIRFQFKGHYLVVGRSGHFAVRAVDWDGKRPHGLTGTVRINGGEARADVVAAIENMIAAGATTGPPH
jgi:hypothetical protein